MNLLTRLAVAVFCGLSVEAQQIQLRAQLAYLRRAHR